MIVSSPQISPELALVFKLCLLPISERELEDAGKLISQLQDWKAFIFWVRRHGVVGSVLQNLKRLDAQAIPPAVIRSLNQQHQRASLHDMKLIAALAQTDRILRQNRIEYLALKGPALSQVLFGSPFVRHSGDLDLLVTIENVKKTEDLLLAFGYKRKEPEQELTPKQFKYYLKFHHHSVLISPENIPTELHWSVREPYLFSADSSREMFGRRRPVNLANHLTIETLSPEDCYVHALLHGTVHRWNSAKFLRDLMAWENHVNFDVTLVENIIKKENLLQILEQGNWLAETIYINRSLPLPGTASRSKKNKKLSFIKQVAIQNLIANNPTPLTIRPRRIQYEPHLKPGWRYFYYAFFESFVNARYWKRVALTDNWFNAYFVIVPILDIYVKLIKPFLQIYDKK